MGTMCQKEETEEQKPENANPNQDGNRIQWASPMEFILTCIGYSVGLGNVWRFPYLCYKSGGGAFLIPYMLMIALIGMPLLFMEYGFGQYFGVGSLSIYKKVCPMFQGIGIGYIVVNALVCIYYNVIIALSLYYLFASFTTKTLPWASCDNPWNTPQCGDPVSAIAAADNGTVVAALAGNMTVTAGYALADGGNTTMTSLLSNVTANLARTSPSDEYFKYHVLDMRPEHNIENIGHLQWKLVLCLLLAWVLVVMFVSRGIQSTGKVAYFTATFPYVMLTVLVARGVTLPGASKGILYFVKPQFHMLLKPEVWFGAATQLFYSTNLAWGGMITMASYNSFKHNCLRDAVMINIVSFCTSIYAGFAVFSIIGYMANEYGVEVENIIESGPGLAFVVYPRALSLMPLAPLWSGLFFFMLFLLGVGSQMVIVETVMTGLVDEFPKLGLNACMRILTAGAVCTVFCLIGLPMVTQMVQVETIMTAIVDNWRLLSRSWLTRLLTACVVCGVGFLIGLPMTAQMVDVETVMTGILDEIPFLRYRRMPVLIVVATCFFLLGLPQTCQGGMYVLQLMDWYSAGFSVLMIAVFECVCINYFYGNEKFSANIKEMIGFYPHIWWKICWKFISPVLIVAILIFSLVVYAPAAYGTYRYPAWADGLGWVMAMASVLPIFIVAGLKLYQSDGNTLKEKFLDVIEPTVVIEAMPKTTYDDIELGSDTKSAEATPFMNGSESEKRNSISKC